MNKKNREKFNQEIVELKKIKGKERVADIRVLVDYTKTKEGEREFKRLEDYLRNEYNFYIPDLKSFFDTDWISASIPHIILVAIVRFFNWDEKDVFEMGKNGITYSRTLKTFMKYFISIEQTLKKIISEWNKYYTEGTVVLVDFNKNKKEAILDIKNFKTHPLLCFYLSGFMERFIEITTGSKNAKAREIKCIFKGDDCHEFKLTW